MEGYRTRSEQIGRFVIVLGWENLISYIPILTKLAYTFNATPLSIIADFLWGMRIGYKMISSFMGRMHLWE